MMEIKTAEEKIERKPKNDDQIHTIAGTRKKKKKLIIVGEGDRERESEKKSSQNISAFVWIHARSMVLIIQKVKVVRISKTRERTHKTMREENARSVGFQSPSRAPLTSTKESIVIRTSKNIKNLRSVGWRGVIY